MAVRPAFATVDASRRGTFEATTDHAFAFASSTSGR